MEMESSSNLVLEAKIINIFLIRFIEFTAGFASHQKEYYELLRGRPGVNGELSLSIKEVFLLKFIRIKPSSYLMFKPNKFSKGF